MWGKKTIKNLIKKYYGVDINISNDSNINTENISTIQTCSRILIENVSRLPILVKDSEGNVIKNHIVSKLFNKSFSNYLTADKGRKIIEKDRVINGNGFVKIVYDNKGLIVGLIPVVYEAIEGIILKNDILYYVIDHNLNPYSSTNNKETISGENMLHFTGSNINGFLGVSPIESLMFESTIKHKASETLINFYKNNAMNPLVLSSTIPDLSQVKSLKEFTENFELENAGSSNAGKLIKLNPGMRLDAINYKLADAELINTLKFTNEQIISAFGIPSFLMSYETTQSIENQTLEFKTFTLNNILSSYKSEIENKLFDSKELELGYSIEFDYSTLLDCDLETKANAYQKLVTNGLITPNEAIRKLGLGKPIDGNNGDKHYLQAQYVDLESNNKNSLENE